METNEIQELMLLGNVTITKNHAYLDCEDLIGNYLDVISTPRNDKWNICLYDYNNGSIKLTDEQYNMICKYMESEFNEYHSNNTAFTDEDKEHFNSLIN